MALRLRSLILLAHAYISLGARPNFVIFFGDDWGWGDLGANWAQTKGLTNNLDKIAQQGIRFEDFHVGASVCTPSRAALMTGRLGLRTGVVTNFSPSSLFGLPRNETTIAELLNASGYRTGMIGKWHLGTYPGFHPVDRGFQTYLGVPYSIDMGCGAQPVSVLAPMPSNNETMFCAACQKTGEPKPACVADPSCGRPSGCVDPTIGLPLFRNHTIVQQPTDLDGLSKMYDIEIHRFISSAAAAGDPFFLYFAASHVHVPQNHAPDFENRSTTPHATRENGGRHFAAALMEMDHSAGEIVQALAAAGVADDTMIMVTGDNGPWECKCNLTGTAGPFLGLWQKEVGGGGSTGKMTPWEGGHRVPGIISWPSRITPGVSSALTSSLDFFPTIAALAGASLPSGRRYDGMDLSDLLISGDDIGHSTLFHPDATCKMGEIIAARQGQLKAIWRVGGQTACGGKKAVCQDLSMPLVFDLGTDPAERWPLNASTHSGISDVVAGFNKLRQQYLDDVAQDATSRANYDGGPAGRDVNCCNKKHPACACDADSSVYLV